MTWHVEVWVRIHDNHRTWQPVRPSGSDQPYEFSTREEAQRWLETFAHGGARFEPDRYRLKEVEP